MTTLRARWKFFGSVAVAVAVVVAVAVILGATALSSSDSDGSSTVESDTEQAILDFAQCMRDNGVPSFPDPVAEPDGSFRLQRPAGASASALDEASWWSPMRNSG